MKKLTLLTMLGLVQGIISAQEHAQDETIVIQPIEEKDEQASQDEIATIDDEPTAHDAAVAQG